MPASKIVTGVVTNLDNWLFKDLGIGQSWNLIWLLTLLCPSQEHGEERCRGKLPFCNMCSVCLVRKPDSGFIFQDTLSLKTKY